MRHPRDAKETPLERLLAAAQLEPGRRPEFYRCLLDSTILALVEPLPGQRGKILPVGSVIQVKKWMREDGDWVVPFFSSPEAVFRAIPQGDVCVPLTGRELFEGTLKSSLHLNPFSEHGREFAPLEVESLLRTGTIASPTKKLVIDERRVTLQVPAGVSTIMLRSLQILYASLPSVKAAYVAEVTYQEASESATLLLGLDVEDDFKRVVRETTTVIVDTHDRKQEVDVTRIQKGKPGRATEYFLEGVRPFYQHDAHAATTGLPTRVTTCPVASISKHTKSEKDRNGDFPRHNNANPTSPRLGP